MSSSLSLVSANLPGSNAAAAHPKPQQDGQSDPDNANDQQGEGDESHHREMIEVLQHDGRTRKDADRLGPAHEPAN